MSDQPNPSREQPNPVNPVTEPQVHEEPEHNEEEDVENGEDASQLYHQICKALNTTCGQNESPDEFKIRVITEFSDLSDWPDAKYEMLPKDVQDWIFQTTTIHKANKNKKRQKALPALPGLDPMPEAAAEKKRGRVRLADEPKRGRTRAIGDDCLTRTMRILVASNEPEKLKAVDLVKDLEGRYGKEYSVAAVRYAQQAFVTARDLINQNSAS